MNKAIFIYDNEGNIFHWSIGEPLKIPNGLPYIIVEDYNYENRAVVKIDVTQNPHVPIYSLTEEELMRENMSLEDYKNMKILNSKKLLEEYLELHPLASTAHSGIEGIYSVTSEKQSLMTSNYLAYQIESQINPNTVLTWNETGKTCEVWTEQEFLQLVLEIRNYIKPKIEIQQIYEASVNNATTKDEIDLIELNYEEVNINEENIEEELESVE